VHPALRVRHTRINAPGTLEVTIKHASATRSALPQLGVRQAARGLIAMIRTFPQQSSSYSQARNIHSLRRPLNPLRLLDVTRRDFAIPLCYGLNWPPASVASVHYKTTTYTREMRPITALIR
jgi:hypothetical protein